MQSARQVLFVCATALALCGCAGYKLGPTTGIAPGSKSIQLQPFANRTLEPHLTDALSTALRKQLQRDGTYRLATKGDADIVLNGEVIDYRRTELSYQPTDAVSVLDYRVAMSARVIARDNATGKILLDREVQAATLVRMGADLANAERQALPLLAEAMAKSITELLVDGDWETETPPTR